MACRTTEQAISDIGFRQYGQREPYVKPPFVSRPLKIVNDRFIVGFGATPEPVETDTSRKPHESAFLQTSRRAMMDEFRNILKIIKEQAKGRDDWSHATEEIIAQRILQEFNEARHLFVSETDIHEHMLRMALTHFISFHKEQFGSRHFLTSLKNQGALQLFTTHSEELEFARLQDANPKGCPFHAQPPDGLAGERVLVEKLIGGHTEGTRIATVVIDGIWNATQEYNQANSVCVDFESLVEIKGLELVRSFAKGHTRVSPRFFQSACEGSFDTYTPHFRPQLLQLVRDKDKVEVGIDGMRLTQQEIWYLSHLYDSHHEGVPRITCPALGVAVDDLFQNLLSLYLACMKQV